MSYTFYVGTYTNTGSKGIYRAALSDAGKLSLIDATEVASPSYLIYSSDRKYIYSAIEADEIDGVAGGGVAAFEVLGDGALKKAAVRATGDGSPCHVHEHGGYLYASNYGVGTVTAFPLEDGIPGKAEFTHVHEGRGPNESRQKGPHAHCAMTVPGTDVFCVVDLGIDQVRFYRKAGKSLELTQALALPGGSGPRHIVFSRDGRFGWVVTELSNEVYCIERKAEWVITGRYPTLPPGFAGRSACAAIRLSPDERLIAASNRFHDSVACFNADGATGLLTQIGIFALGGEATPRDINFSPDGRWLLTANQDSDSVIALSVDGGFKIAEGAKLNIPRACCILF